MRPRNLFALLVGINVYPAESQVSRLVGCVHDISRIDRLFSKSLPDYITYHPLIVKNHEATRERIIRELRTHLGQAKPGDIIFFMFCGHGSRQPSDPLFHKYYPDGKDETLVCYNSRLAGGFDLADKELAVLLGEVTKPGIESVVVLDCCHSGSGTRNLDDFQTFSSREASSINQPRRLETYLNGYFSTMMEKLEILRIPPANHLLLSACSRHQKAYENLMGYGEFSNALADILERTNLKVSYRDLFTWCRQWVMRVRTCQVPQFEVTREFDMASNFLGIYPPGMDSSNSRINITREAGRYFLEMGILHGLSSEKIEDYVLEIYPSCEGERIARSGIVSIGLDRSEITLPEDFPDNSTLMLEARMVNFPHAPIRFDYYGPDSFLEVLKKILPEGEPVTPHSGNGSAHLCLRCDGENLVLENSFHGPVISYSRLTNENALHLIAEDLRQIAIWRTLKVKSLNWEEDYFPFLDIEVGYFQGGRRSLVTLSRRQEIGIPLKKGSEGIFPFFRIRNQEDRTLYFTLLFLSPAFGVNMLYQNEVIPTKEWVHLWGGRKVDELFIRENQNYSLDSFVLIVSEEPFSCLEVISPDIVWGEKIKNRNSKPSLHPGNKWILNGIEFILFKEYDFVGSKPLTIGSGVLTLLPHPNFRASLSICSVFDPALWKHSCLFASDLLLQVKIPARLLALTKTGLWEGNVLRLDHWEGGVNQGCPIVFELDLETDDKEKMVWAIGFNGNKVLLLGQSMVESNGRGHLAVSQCLPESQPLWITFLITSVVSTLEGLEFLYQDS